MIEREGRRRVATGVAAAVVAAAFAAAAIGVASASGSAFDPSVGDPRNRWFIDFDAYARSFFTDMVQHGLAAGALDPGAPVNARAKAKLVERAIERANEAFLRNPDGTSRGPGLSLAIALTADEPDPRLFPDGPGIDYARTCVMGGRNARACTGGTLGAQFLDFGNYEVEWQCRAGRLGVFAGRICGLASVLSPPLDAQDLPFVDGTYRVGVGTPQDDARFIAVDAALFDWGTAIGNVVAHEVGHALGLDHDAGSGFIMQAYVDAADLSDARRAFGAQSLAVLARNVGFSR
jgi:hypothetical protein